MQSATRNSDNKMERMFGRMGRTKVVAGGICRNTMMTYVHNEGNKNNRGPATRHIHTRKHQTKDEEQQKEEQPKKEETMEETEGNGRRPDQASQLYCWKETACS